MWLVPSASSSSLSVSPPGLQLAASARTAWARGRAALSHSAGVSSRSAHKVRRRTARSPWRIQTLNSKTHKQPLSLYAPRWVKEMLISPDGYREIPKHNGIVLHTFRINADLKETKSPPSVITADNGCDTNKPESRNGRIGIFNILK